MKIGLTKRFVLLIFLGIAFLGLSILVGGTLSIFIIYNLICITLLLIDFFISRDEEDLGIGRAGDRNLSIYEREAISFIVYNRGKRTLNLELKDEIPEHHFKWDSELIKLKQKINIQGKEATALDVKEVLKQLSIGEGLETKEGQKITQVNLRSGIIKNEKTIKRKVKPKERVRVEYFITPTKRGAYKFGKLHVKFEGRLGLCTKLYTLNLEGEYKVYPNLKDLRKYKLSLTNNRMMKQGSKRLKMLGRGTSFESLREYIPGDEYRKINWKATAREGKPIINQYEPEKNQHVHIMIDTGRPMSYSVRGYRKLDMAVNTALILSDIVNQNGDQSGLMLFNTDVSNMIMPGKGVGHRQKILEELYHIDATNHTSNYEEAFYYFKRKERHRSIVFLFTDFETLEEAENMLRVLPVIAKNNLLIIMLIKNESLLNIGSIEPKSKEDIFNKGVALELIEERKRIIGLLNRRGILCEETEAEKLEFSAVNKYIQVKNRNYL